MSITNKLITIAENEHKVYAAGHQSGYNDGYEAGLAESGGGSYDNGYNDGYVEGNEQGYDLGYTDGWDFGESSGTHDGFEVGVGFGEDTQKVVCFSGYESWDFGGTYSITIDNPKQLIVTVSKECVFDAFELTDAEGTTHTWDIGELDEGTYTFDIPDDFVCNADDGYGEVYLSGSCTDYGIVGVSVTNKPSYDEGYDEGVEAGKQARDVEWWDTYLKESDYHQYMFAGRSWTVRTFNPIGTFYCNPVNAYGMFMAHNGDASEPPYDLVAKLEETNFNLTFAEARVMTQCFYFANLSRVGVIDTRSITSKANSASLFNGSKVVTIDKLIVKTRSFDWNGNEFSSCSNLENITVEGVIGNNGLNWQWSPLTHDSLMSIINALADKSGESGTWTITFGETNLAKLTDDELKIIEDKGWQYG